MDAQPYALEIVNRLVRAGYIAFFAGGWVRDYLLGHPSDDIDIATDAPPEKILDLFPRTLLVGLAFGIVIVIIDGHQFEVATFRRDIDYKEGRRPERIELSSPQEDALRRDFTINGMFYDPIEKVIHDYVQGQHDLKSGIIRSIGNPYDRFFEDRLRMIRAIRFAARFGFKIDLETEEAIQENAITLFPAVAMERVWQEFNKMSAFPHFGQALVEMHRLKLLQVIFPALEHVHLNEIKKRTAPLAFYPATCPTILYLLALFPDFTSAQAAELCLYLRTSSQDAKLAEAFIESKKHFQNIAANDYDWTIFYSKPFASLFLEVLAAHLDPSHRKLFIEEHAERQKTLANHVEKMIAKRPVVTAAHLHAKQIPSGKPMGVLLREAERLSVLHDLDDPEQVIALLKKLPGWPKED